MFLKCSTRKKDGQEHRSWSVVESCRVGRGVGQRHVLYLGEINDSQRVVWPKAIAVFDEHDGQTRPCALFPADRTPPLTATPAVQVQLNQLQLSRPRAWGACWLGDQLWRDLQLDTFFAARLGCSREGTDWEKVLRVLTLYRLLSPGSEWRLHRHWFATTACADLLGADERLAQDDTLYRGLDGLLAHKDALFAHLRSRWSDLFGAKFDVLLYDLTSTYFECDVPEDQSDPRRFGYSRVPTTVEASGQLTFRLDRAKLRARRQRERPVSPAHQPERRQPGVALARLHAFFYPHNPDAFTPLGQARHCYGVKRRYAPTPQAKGKI